MSDYLCTCCEPARPMERESNQHEWQHSDDATYAEVFHIHDETSSCDCDGPLDRSRTYRIRSLRWFDGELAYKMVPEPDKDDLWRKMCNLTVPFYAADTEARTTENSDGLLTLTWHRRTDEGFEGGELIGCNDPTCAHDPASQRDHFAEAMGY